MLTGKKNTRKQGWRGRAKCFCDTRKEFLFLMCVCVCVCVYNLRTCGVAGEGEKKSLGGCGLERERERKEWEEGEGECHYGKVEVRHCSGGRGGGKKRGRRKRGERVSGKNCQLFLLLRNSPKVVAFFPLLLPPPTPRANQTIIHPPPSSFLPSPNGVCQWGRDTHTPTGKEGRKSHFRLEWVQRDR